MDKFRSRVVLQGRNPYIDNQKGSLSPVLGSYLPYSQVFHLTRGAGEGEDGNTYCILRHYLNIPSLSEEQIQSVKVVACSEDTMENVEVIEEKTITESLPAEGNVTEGNIEAGIVVVTVHKARNLEKRGLVGRADPYVVIKYREQQEKSATVNNNQNPAWQMTGYFEVKDQSDNEITIEVFDEDFLTEDDFLGKLVIDIQEIRRTKSMDLKWIPLESCNTGEVLLSAKFVPLEKANKPVGQIMLTVHKAKKIEKKKMMKKADPYIVIRFGKDTYKSETVNNSQNPSWNFKLDLSIIELSPRHISLEVFDDDIGEDAFLGDLSLDTETLKNKQNMEKAWYHLDNCKSGDILLSAEFKPASNESFEEIEIEEKSTEVQGAISIQHANIETKPRNQSLDIITPVYCDSEYVIVEKKTNSWFMVVSPLSNLPINVNLVPFQQPTQNNIPIHIYPLPGGGFHNIKRVVHSGRGLKLCGYENPCVLKAGVPYQFFINSQGRSINLGDIKIETWGPDRDWVVYSKDGETEKDFIEAAVKLSEKEDPEFYCTIKLYNKFDIEAA